MDACLLANTGADMYLLLGGAVAVVVTAVAIGLRRTSRLTHVVFSAVLVLGLSILPVNTFAAPICNPTASPAQTTGAQGQPQVLNIAVFSTPTPGATFVFSSLRLALRSASPTGSVLSDGNLTAIIPTEGGYTALPANGTITFSPESNFVGTGTGVIYSVNDTAGNTLTNTYTPTVTSEVSACQDPAFEGLVVHPRNFYFWGGFSDNDTVSTPLAGIGTTMFTSVASSADGTKLAAVASDGSVYTSTNAGLSWTERTVPGSQGWNAIASSADGTKLAAVASWGSIYTSTDSGVTWTEQATPGSLWWNTITSSADGTKLAAAVFEGSIYTSSDSGVTWTEQTSAGSGQWQSITSSADGTKLAAVAFGSSIYTSIDSGATWIAQANTSGQAWQSITSSADGTKLAAAVSWGSIYTSTDSGVTWNEHANTSGQAWQSITSSADGTKLAAAIFDGSIYTSADSGATWSEQTASNSRSWQSVRSSADGVRLVAVADNAHYVYTSADSGATWTAQYRTLINPNDIDIDPATPGLQTTIDKTSSEGWSAAYNPLTDLLTLTVVDSILLNDHFDTTNDYKLVYYTLYRVNCSQPQAAPITVTINPG